MDRFLIKPAFRSEALLTKWRGACLRPMLIRGNAVRLRMVSIVSKNQNISFALETEIITTEKV